MKGSALDKIKGQKIPTGAHGLERKKKKKKKKILRGFSLNASGVYYLTQFRELLNYIFH